MPLHSADTVLFPMLRIVDALILKVAPMHRQEEVLERVKKGLVGRRVMRLPSLQLVASTPILN